MKAFAVLTNIFLPGVGSLFIGQVAQGIAQIVIYGLGAIFTFITLGIGGIIGIPMMLGAWIWGIVTAAGHRETVQVTVVNNGVSGDAQITRE